MLEQCERPEEIVAALGLKLSRASEHVEQPAPSVVRRRAPTFARIFSGSGPENLVLLFVVDSPAVR